MSWASLTRDLVPSLRVGAGAWRWLAGLGLAGILALLALLGLGEVARRVGVESPTPSQSGRPLVAVLPFENQTSDASVAWVGDALGELLAARLEGAGVRTLGPEAVRWLDPDTVAWRPDGVLTPPRAVAVNVVADRSAAQRVVAGRVRRNGDGLLACVEVLAPPERVPVEPELCGPIDLNRLFEAHGAPRPSSLARPRRERAESAAGSTGVGGGVSPLHGGSASDSRAGVGRGRAPAGSVAAGRPATPPCSGSPGARVVVVAAGRDRCIS